MCHNKYYYCNSYIKSILPNYKDDSKEFYEIKKDYIYTTLYLK